MAVGPLGLHDTGHTGGGHHYLQRGINFRGSAFLPFLVCYGHIDFDIIMTKTV